MEEKFVSPSRKLFLVINTIVLIALGVLCVIPMFHVLALSLSGKTAVAGGSVLFTPVDFSTTAYSFVLKRPAFWNSMGVSFLRVLTGGLLNMALIVLTAYPLSKSKEKFKYRTPFVWFFFASSLFNGGLIPGYVLIRNLGLLDTMGALIFPTAVPVFSVVLMLNFFRQVPEELDEAAQIDGANKFRTLISIYLPVSLPSLATVLLFSIVSHWNSYFDGLIFSNFPSSYPLQTYLRTILVSGNLASMAGDDWKLLQDLSDRTVKSAQIFIAIIPILCIYPFVQRYFVKGMTVGSVKG